MPYDTSEIANVEEAPPEIRYAQGQQHSSGGTVGAVDELGRPTEIHHPEGYTEYPVYPRIAAQRSQAINNTGEVILSYAKCRICDGPVRLEAWDSLKEAGVCSFACERVQKACKRAQKALGRQPTDKELERLRAFEGVKRHTRIEERKCSDCGKAFQPGSTGNWELCYDCAFNRSDKHVTRGQSAGYRFPSGKI